MHKCNHRDYFLLHSRFSFCIIYKAIYICIYTFCTICLYTNSNCTPTRFYSSLNPKSLHKQSGKGRSPFIPIFSYVLNSHRIIPFFSSSHQKCTINPTTRQLLFYSVERTTRITLCVYEYASDSDLF